MRIGRSTFGATPANWIWLVILIAGLAAWVMLPGPSDAEDQLTATPTTVLRSAQRVNWLDPAITATQSTPVNLTQSTTPAGMAMPPLPAPALEIAVPETAAPAKSPLEGLTISSQSWRRGGLGSKALVTLTLRNRNDFAVRDIEIACAFTRRDGSHLTDRKRVISDTIGTKSRKTYAGMLVGFVNINANKAKCAVVTASRI